MTCKHEFDFRINVIFFEDKPGQGSLDIAAKCKYCSKPVVFYGPRGANAPYPVASVDRLELRVPMTIGYEPKFLPGPTMLINGPEIVPLGQKPDA